MGPRTAGRGDLGRLAKFSLLTPLLVVVDIVN